MLNLRQLKFPLFPVPKSLIIENRQGLLVALDGIDTYKIIDDANLPGEDLGRRRLLYALRKTKTDPKLYPLKGALGSFFDLLHYNAKTNIYIDASGKVIKYTKSESVPLTYHKVEKTKLTDLGTVVYVKDIHCRFLINRVLNLDEHYAGLLRVNRGWLLYDFSSEKKKDGRRKI